MSAHIDDLAVVEHDNAIRVHNGGDALGDDNFGGFGHGIPQRGADARVGGGIHGGGRVVKDNDLGLFQQRPGDAQPLLLAAGNVHAALAKIHIISPGQSADKFIRRGGLAGGGDFRVGGVGVAPAQVFFNGAGEQHVLLQHHGHLIPQDVDIVFPHVPAAHQHAARRSRRKAGE